MCVCVVYHKKGCTHLFAWPAIFSLIDCCHPFLISSVADLGIRILLAMPNTPTYK